jgi:hypothetical protein
MVGPALLLCAVLLLASAAAPPDGRRGGASVTSAGKPGGGGDAFAWGAPCDGELSVGLHLEGGAGRAVAPATTLRWRWALRNAGRSPRQVTIQHDADTSFRVRLRITRPGQDAPLWDFPLPADARTTTAQGATRVTVPPGKTVELPGGAASIDAGWGPGSYRLQLIYGGPGFKFDCRSAFADLTVK